MPRHSIARRRPRRRVGGALKDWISRAHNFVKNNKLVSRGLNHFSKSHKSIGPLAAAIRHAGYGRRGGSLGMGRRCRRGGALRLS